MNHYYGFPQSAGDAYVEILKDCPLAYINLDMTFKVSAYMEFFPRGAIITHPSGDRSILSIDWMLDRKDYTDEEWGVICEHSPRPIALPTTLADSRDISIRVGKQVKKVIDNYQLHREEYPTLTEDTQKFSFMPEHTVPGFAETREKIITRLLDGVPAERAEIMKKVLETQWPPIPEPPEPVVATDLTPPTLFHNWSHVVDDLLEGLNSKQEMFMAVTANMEREIIKAQVMKEGKTDLDIGSVGIELRHPVAQAVSVDAQEAYRDSLIEHYATGLHDDPIKVLPVSWYAEKVVLLNDGQSVPGFSHRTVNFERHDDALVMRGAINALITGVALADLPIETWFEYIREDLGRGEFTERWIFYPHALAAIDRKGDKIVINDERVKLKLEEMILSFKQVELALPALKLPSAEAPRTDASFTPAPVSLDLQELKR